MNWGLLGLQALNRLAEASVGSSSTRRIWWYRLLKNILPYGILLDPIAYLECLGGYGDSDSGIRLGPMTLKIGVRSRIGCDSIWCRFDGCAGGARPSIRWRLSRSRAVVHSIAAINCQSTRIILKLGMRIDSSCISMCTTVQDSITCFGFLVTNRSTPVADGGYIIDATGRNDGSQLL